jgi:hypothetical protein
MTAGWRKLHNEELHNLYSLTDIIRVIKSRRMRWAGHVDRLGAMRNEYKILVENLKERDCLENLGVNYKIILKWILGNRVRGCG